MEAVKDDKNVERLAENNRSLTASNSITSTQPTPQYCPLCKRKLVQKYLGLVCKNWNCSLYNKFGKGWILIKKETLLESQKFHLDIIFSLNIRENQINWLITKRKIFSRDNYTCQKCNTQYLMQNSPFKLHAHHILPRAEYPEFTFEIDNIITLCEECHKDIHKNDQYAFRQKVDQNGNN